MTITIPLSMRFTAQPLEPTSSWWTKIKTFCTETITTAKNKVVSFIKGFYHHAESVAILTLSSLGLSALLGELPFWLALPWWVEAPMVIPVLSVFMIFGLVTIGEKRTKKRLAHA